MNYEDLAKLIEHELRWGKKAASYMRSSLYASVRVYVYMCVCANVHMLRACVNCI